MSKWIVEKIILNLISRGLNIANAETLILGFTFKENCPDIRNTKVIDIIRNLKKYNIDPTIVDPLADKHECAKLYDINIFKNIPTEKYDLIILTVGHEEFRKFNYKEWTNLKKKDAVIIDLKNTVPREIEPLRI